MKVRRFKMKKMMSKKSDLRNMNNLILIMITKKEDKRS